MKKFHCLFLAFACAYSTLMAQTPAHIDLNVQLKDQNNDPVRDARLELEITIEQDGAKVYKETQSPVWTNYDGYLSIRVGEGNSTQWGQIDWNAATKKVIIKGRPDGQSGAQYEVLYDEFLPVAAYAQFVKPYARRGGSITLFSDPNNPGIELMANTGIPNIESVPYIDFENNASPENSNYVARITLQGRSLGFLARDAEFKFQRSPALGEIDLEPHTNAALKLKGGAPYIDFYPERAERNRIGRIIAESNPKSIRYISNKHLFEGDLGPITVTGEVDYGPHDITYLSHPNSQGTARNTYGYSIKTSSRILTTSLHIYSDRRTKANTSPYDKDKALGLLAKLKVVNYSYRDFWEKGRKQKIGFIAQEIEEILPEVVSSTTDVIPDICQIGENLIYDDDSKTLTVAVDSLLDLKVGEKVRLLGKRQHMVEVVEVNGTTFTVKNWPEENTKEVFVYGREVNDFRTLDYDQIFTLNVSATQALIKEVEELKTQLTAQKQVSESLQNENQNLEAELRRINSRIDALAKIVYEKDGHASSSTTGTN